MKRLAFAAGLLLVAASSLAAPPAASTGSAPDTKGIDFAELRSVLELKPSLSPYRPSGPAARDNSAWYALNALNSSATPVTRVLQTAEPAGSSLHFFPPSTRPAILGIASTDPAVSISSDSAYGHRAFKVVIPASSKAALAIHVLNGDVPPSVLAWNESALAAQNRRLAIFIASVAGLIAAAALLVGGLAVMTFHAAPRWAALTLLGVLLIRLTATGMFDAGLATSWGGPYGLAAMFAGLSLAAGVKLADTIQPISRLWPPASPFLNWGLYGLISVSLLAYLGIPGMALLTEFAVLLGTAGVAAYLVHCGRLGARPARAAAPSATVFALVALAVAVAALGGFTGNLAAPEIVGGFSGAGALLLALAVIAGEGIAELPATRLALTVPDAAPVSASAAPPPLAEAIPFSTAALKAIGASHQGVFDLDLGNDIVALSGEGASMLGFRSERQQFDHPDWIARIHAEDRAAYTQSIEDFRDHPGLAFRIEFRLKSEAGRYPWFELRATMLGDTPPATRCLGLIADVTTRKEAETAQAARGLHDPLTGLGNRVALMEELERIGDGLGEINFALLDIDRFKSIHASLGDAGADAVLVDIADRLARRFDGIARIFRVGGDSFAVLDAGGKGEPSAIGADLVEACNTQLFHGGRNVFAPASVGVSRGCDARDPLDLLKNAELALLQAKRQGGGCARVYSRDLELLAPGDSVVLEAELRRALEDDQLDVFYQPIVRLADRAIVGFEALLRWHHPVKGLVAPADFIGHSEETGLIVALGRFALERAAHELAVWQLYFPLDPPLFVGVNLSRRQLRDDEFEILLRRIFSTETIAPGTLKLELTETSVATTENAKATLEKLKLLGAGLAIDDFGTGLSNLSQLRELPFDTLKIDRSFLSNRGGGSNDAATVLRSVVSLAQELGRSVIVEGVETESDAQWVKDLGCELAQGFCFSQALPANEARNFLAMHFDARTAVGRAASGATGFGG